MVDGNPTAGHTDDQPVPNSPDIDKVFHSLWAADAWYSHMLQRCTDPNDDAVTYWAERWGLVRYLPTLDDAEKFLAQIGGSL